MNDYYTHSVRVFNGIGACLSRNDFSTAEKAYEFYKYAISITKNRIQKGEEVTIARFNESNLMTLETIKG